MRFGIPKLDDLTGEIKDGSVILIEGVGDLVLILAREFLKNAISDGYRTLRMERFLFKSFSRYPSL